MRVGLFADVHGNPDALRAVLLALEDAELDSLHFLGDALGYLPGETECLEILDGYGVRCQKGNHEAMLLATTAESEERDAVYQLAAARSRIDAVTTASIRAWPDLRELRVGDRRLLLVHGSPDEPLTGYLYPDTDLSPFADPSFDAIVCGHTHRPFVRRTRGPLFANVGSVGLPRDVGRLASVAMYDSDSNSFEIWRVPFDVAAVVDRWGPRLHEQTRACLLRDSTSFVGEVMKAERHRYGTRQAR